MILTKPRKLKHIFLSEVATMDLPGDEEAAEPEEE